jgi:hypothetical protein
MVYNKKQNETRHQLWIDEDLYQKLVKDKVRDESVNSYIGYLYEFHKNSAPQLKELI